MPSADMRSNRCVPLRGTSAGYASASSASIKFLKSGSIGRLLLRGDAVSMNKHYRTVIIEVNTDW